jgi:hypothetical protein
MMELEIIVRDNSKNVVFRKAFPTAFNPTEIVLDKPFQIDEWLVTSFALGVVREKIKKIVFGKEYETGRGLPVEILKLSAKGMYPVIGIISYKDGSDDVFRWDARGCTSVGSPENLVEKKR